MNITQVREEIIVLYKSHFEEVPEEIIELPQTGSIRKYFRIKGKASTTIGTFNIDIEENEAFFYLSKILDGAGVNIPKLLSISANRMFYLQEDLGDSSLYQLVTEESEEKDIELYYKKVLEQMPLVQHEVSKTIDFDKCFPRRAFDSQSILWDLNYFKYLFLKLTHIPFHEQQLEDEFQKLIVFLNEAPSNFFLFRDFQSRNIIFKNDVPYFIDFQGGRKGALQYDLASLLFESKTNLSLQTRERLLEHYCSVFEKYEFFSKSDFKKYFPAFVLIRLLQAFGAYGYRGIFEKKAFFVQSIQNGLKNLQWVSEQENIRLNFPYLHKLIIQMQGLSSEFYVPKNKDGLTVSITSFSYKNGLPNDWSGNGGGHVFDCRSLPNPGRMEEYRGSTGRDINVITYLEKENEVDSFRRNVQNLVDATVSKYIDRNFNNLAISFGCTGGQHRSVYMAEKLFTHLKLNFDVNLRLNHRELKVGKQHDKNDVQEK